MKHTWTIIGVSDVPVSFKWYQSLFGQPETPPAHDDFGQILDTDGTVLLCLHQWGAHEHPSLMSPDEASPGNGLLLVLPRRRLRDGPEEGTRSRRPVRRGAPREPEHSNKRVLTPRSRRILRDDQCALCAPVKRTREAASRSAHELGVTAKQKSDLVEFRLFVRVLLRHMDGPQSRDRLRARGHVRRPTCRSSTASERTCPRFRANTPMTTRPIARAPMAAAPNARAPSATAPTDAARIDWAAARTAGCIWTDVSDRWPRG